ncbi:ABC transporter permease [Rhizobium sp. AC44/96]|uniref:ABC transporter permease n=1 Tax=unclassified Rhizobium TaxID=2613769 RepID=UPI00081013D6|nr:MULTISPECIES: ABC transporter permease [unclassified Rhizobium]MDM9622711.1 ABC transporter permease [Rhizobium sp. S96]OCJ13370.1 ABC transporter permease [Rhizobium sp. AC44/96]
MRNLPRLTPMALIGFAGTIAFLVLAVFAPWLAPHPVSEVVGGVWDVPSGNALLGTDNIGRDLFSRLVWGARLTFVIAAIATALAFLIGVSLGFYAAVRRGWVDQALSRLNDLMMSIPTLIFALVVLAVLPKNMVVLVLVMAALDATRVFRVSRALAADLVVLDYVEVARLRGESWAWIIVNEILPNALSPLLAELGLRFAFAILFLSTLSFLGLGVQPPVADWGSLVKENKDGLVFGVFAALIPGAAIAILVISINLVVDWMLQKTSSLKGGRRNG